MYLKASSSQIKRLENSLPTSWQANMEKGVVVSLNMKEIKLESLCFKKHLTHIGSLNTKKPSRKELSCSTSQSKGEEKRTKSEDSLEPYAHGFFEKLFGFSRKRDQCICSIHEGDESPNLPSEGDEEDPCTTKYPIVQHLVGGNVEGEMNPNFFVADFKISAEDMGQIDDGDTCYHLSCT